MQMNVNLNISQTVTPQLIAAMTVLQCGPQELRDYLEELSYENPMMDLREPEQHPSDSVELVDRLRWLKGSDRQNRNYYDDTEGDSVDQYLSTDTDDSLKDFVKEQILTLDAPLALRSAMETVAELLDERGLYTGTVQEIAELAQCGEAVAAEALERVRAMEPPGVAAAGIPESLLAQLRRLNPRNPLAERILAEHYALLGTWSDARLARELSAAEEEVRAARAMIGTLNPYPGNGFSGQEQIQYITPDLSILPGENGLTVTAEEGYLPTVQINAGYLRMLETETDPEVQKYLRQKLSQVEQVISNVGQRRSTVVRCGEVIAKRQASFFSGGVLVRLTLRDVAEELGVHESTVSRAAANKYIECERGIFPMSHFFMRGAGQNYNVSRDDIQAVMAEIIQQENPKKPLSDEKIVSELAARHITLSRRAVAKYRTELGIPSAAARKHRG